MNKEEYGKPVFIIGAPRSGTNLLRDLICEDERCITWPCDEINGIWKYGNVHLRDDEIKKYRATPQIKAFIRREFSRFWRSNATVHTEFLIEKTCANSLRIDFLKEIFPEAKFIVIFRDGRDVFRSARRRWTGEFEFQFLSYLIRKVRYTPSSVLLVMVISFIRARFRSFFSRQKPLKSWGPTISEFSDSCYGLDDKIALQWCKCVERTAQMLEVLPEEEFITLRYEDLIMHTDSELARLFDFLGMRSVRSIESRGIDIREGSVSDDLPASVSSIVSTRVAKCQRLIEGVSML